MRRAVMSPGFAVALLGACAGPPQSAGGPSEEISAGQTGEARLLVVTGLGGSIAPCGCTSGQLGGLDRLVGQIEAWRARGAAPVVLVGETFFEPGASAPHLEAQRLDRAALIADLLGRLQPALIAPGGVERGSRDDELQRLATGARLGLLPASDGTLLDSQLLSTGGVKVGVVAVVDPTRRDPMAVAARAGRLREEGARFVVALAPSPASALRPWAGSLRGVDLVIAGGSATTSEPQAVGRTLLLEAGDRGQHLGVVTLHPHGDGGWSYFDGGRAERAALEGRIAGLRQRTSALPAGAARSARERKIAELESRRDAVEPASPQGSTFSFELEPISAQLEAAAWATRRMAEHWRSLCEQSIAATAQRQCAQPSDDAARFVGNAVCEPCHQEAVVSYRQTPHARAWEALTTAGRECDLGCIGCHSVGYEQPGGYCRLADATAWAHVGCESCHGPGAGHVESPEDSSAWGSGFGKAVPTAACQRCHTPEHSKEFSDAEYRPRVLGQGHGD